MPAWNRFPGRFNIILLSVAALFLVLEAVNGRLWLNDFRVYYESAGALMRGDAAYGVPHGLSSGYFKYAPALGFLYAPMASLPYPFAAGIQFALIILAFISAVTLADSIIRTRVLPGRPDAYAPLFLATLIAGAHLHRELHLGNINVMLLLVLLGGVRALVTDRPRLAGLLWGLAILAKPHFVVLLPWLLLRGEQRVLAWIFVSIGVGLLAPLPFIGAQEWLDLHRAWLQAMAGHNASMVYAGGEAHQMVDTAYSFVHRAVLGRLLGWSPSATILAVLGCIGAAMGIIILLNRRREATLDGRESHLVQEAFLLVALVPSLTVTDTNHFLFALPLVLLLVHRLLHNSSSRWLPYVAIPCLIAHGGNWSDALGPLSDQMSHYGVLGIANLGLVAIGCILLLSGSNLLPGAMSNRVPST